MEMKQLTLEDFCAKTASSAPTPGGGSVAALTGALSCALTEMVANLTVNKKGYEEVSDEMLALLNEGNSIRSTLLSLIDADCAAYGGYMAALGLPKNTEEEIAARKAALQKAAIASAVAPLQMARTAIRILPLCQAVTERGNKNAVTDALMSAMLARTAVRSAILNVRINLPSLGNNELAAALESECKAMEATAAAYETDIFSKADI